MDGGAKTGKTRPMPTIAELIARQIVPEDKGSHEPRTQKLSGPIEPHSDKPHDQYEAGVFSCLWEHRKQLGIESVLKFTARLVDGCIVLVDGRRLAVEVKYCMNWKKALEAESEFRRFLKRCEGEAEGVKGGIVFFQEFSGDWMRRAACRELENGWSHWYRDHLMVEGLRLDLLRLFRSQSSEGDLRDWNVESFPVSEAGLMTPTVLSREVSG
jgi:hypothetical protein